MWNLNGDLLNEYRRSTCAHPYYTMKTTNSAISWPVQQLVTSGFWFLEVLMKLSMSHCLKLIQYNIIEYKYAIFPNSFRCLPGFKTWIKTQGRLAEWLLRQGRREMTLMLQRRASSRQSSVGWLNVGPLTSNITLMNEHWQHCNVKCVAANQKQLIENSSLIYPNILQRNISKPHVHCSSASRQGDVRSPTFSIVAAAYETVWISC